MTNFLQGAAPVGKYVKVASGKKNQRPQLLAAIAAGGVLLIAKLDRLSRNAGFILVLRDSGVNFACYDMPDANTLTVGLFAVIAQHERETISQRTKDALQAKKARGAQLGTPANLTEEVRLLGLATRQRNAHEHGGIRQATALILARRAQGLSCERIAAKLNALGFTARRGGACYLLKLWGQLGRLLSAKHPPANSSFLDGVEFCSEWLFSQTRVRVLFSAHLRLALAHPGL